LVRKEAVYRRERKALGIPGKVTSYFTTGYPIADSVEKLQPLIAEVKDLME
jgi:hypothetical protein